jgi:hypothetical protein
MDVTEITQMLSDAAEAVEKAALPDTLQQLAFERALDAIGLAPAVAPGSPGPSPAETMQPLGRGSTPNDGALASVSARLGLPLDSLEKIYEDDSEVGLRLIVKRSMLPEPDQKAASMRHIALLIAVGRQVANIEDYTPFSLIRNECAEVKVLDPSNFAKEVGKLGMRQRGSRNQQEAKVNRHHIEEATELIRTMTAKVAA